MCEMVLRMYTMYGTPQAIRYQTGGSCNDLLSLFLVCPTPSCPEGGGKIFAEPNGDQGGEEDPESGNVN